MITDPFDAAAVEWLLEAEPNNPARMRRRESTVLEIKENYNGSAQSIARYAKTMAGFANNQGGYILFGVPDTPHDLIGMTNANFENLDPAILHQTLKEQFDPEPDWSHHMVTMPDGRKFGLFYTRASRVKPILSRRNFQELREGDIYFRYQGATERIRYSDLSRLLTERISEERREWQAMLKEMAKLEPRKAVLIDTSSTRGSTSGGGFFIDETLAEKLKFIQEGKFDEAGEPTLRVIGEAQVVSPDVAGGIPVMIDYDTTHPLKTKELIDRINNDCGAGTINQHQVAKVLKKVLKVEENSDWHYRSSVHGIHQYSEAYANHLMNEIKADPQYLAKAVDMYKQQG